MMWKTARASRISWRTATSYSSTTTTTRRLNLSSTIHPTTLASTMTTNVAFRRLDSASTLAVATAAASTTTSSTTARTETRSLSILPSFAYSSSSSFWTSTMRMAAMAGFVVSSAVAGGDDQIVPLMSPMMMGTPTRCDAVQDGGDQSAQDEEPQEEDPYDNLPPQDEPTHCSICMTYRQGPCRPLWRKVEACTKDNELPTKEEREEQENSGENENDDNYDESSRPDPPCLKYMMPWIECASGYRNLYALIELDTNYTEGIEDLEATASQHLCWMPGAPAAEAPTVDWSAWQDYVTVLNPDWALPSQKTTTTPNPKYIDVKQPWIGDILASSRKKETNTSKTNHKKTPLWKTLDQSSDPEVVSIEAKVPTVREESPASSGKMGVMECAYAVDQDGHVLGFAYGMRPGDAVAGKKQQGEEDNKADGGESECETSTSEDNDEGFTTMTIRLLPDRTRHIVIAASYTQVATDGNDESGQGEGTEKNDNFETHVYKSKPMRLDEMASREN